MLDTGWHCRPRGELHARDVPGRDHHQEEAYDDDEIVFETPWCGFKTMIKPDKCAAWYAVMLGHLI